MKRLVIKTNIGLCILFILAASFLINPKTSLAYSPYSVGSDIINNWDEKYAFKNNNMRSGTNLVYDVYSKKYTNGGYKIVNKNFGNGTKSYLNFQGWAINFGYKRHNYSNHDTYIVAKSNQNADVKIYKTDHINISATEDLEYNNQGSGVWNECSTSATKKDNQYDCNMRYDNVGFNAYLPLNDLFPDQSVDGSWRLYIVKEVSGHIVYSPLILPFDFNNLDYKGGKIDLSSGVNTNRLEMIGTYVYKREFPRQTSGFDYGYFTTGSTYVRKSMDEDDTAVWYGVNSNSRTLWANTAYWRFSGDQAILSFDSDDSPPTHIDHSIKDHKYKNGNDYWIKPNDTVKIRLRGRDPETYLRGTYIRLQGSSQDEIAYYRYSDGYINDWGNYNSSHVDVGSVSKTYESDGKWEREATFDVVAGTHGHSYNVIARHLDDASNYSGYVDTGMNLRVDGKAPTGTHEIKNYRYNNGDYYWYQPNDPIEVTVKGTDSDSGLAKTWLSVGGGSSRIVANHDWHGTSTNLNMHTQTLDGFSVNSINRNLNTTDTKTLTFNLKGNKHGIAQSIRTRYDDNVGNISDHGDAWGWSNVRDYIVIDEKPPEHVSHSITGERYRNGNNYWVQSGDELNVQLRQKDVDSGNYLSIIRLFGSGQDVRYLNNFRKGATDLDPVSTSNYHNTNFTSVNSVERTENSNGYGTTNFKVESNKHGHNYEIQYYYRDNVSNNLGYHTIGRLRADDVAPDISLEKNGKQFLDGDITDQYFTVKSKDDDSGIKRTRYVWTKTQNTPTEKEWSSWSSNSTFNVDQSISGEWYLHVQAEDNVGNVTTEKAGIYLVNTPPELTLTYKPGDIYEGDDVTVCIKPYDADGHLMDVTLELSKNNGSYNRLLYESDISSNTNVCYVIDSISVGEYKLKARVDDGYAYKQIEKSFTAKELSIIGEVLHTEKWNEYHRDEGNATNEFLSGEQFNLESKVTDYPVEYVKVMFEGILINGTTHTSTIPLSKVSSIEYQGILLEPKFSQSGTLLKTGSNPKFTFEVKYKNGTIKTYVTYVNIIGNIYDSFQFHKSY